MIALFGWAAIVLVQSFYIPNTVRIIRTKDVTGYSLLGWSLLCAGLVGYLVYFAALGDLVGIVANLFGVIGCAVTIVCILRWRAR